MSQKNHACMMCPEGRRKLGRVRGLCQGHYQRACTDVREGRTTWQDLAAAGLVTLTPQERGEPRRALYYRRGSFGSTLARAGRIQTRSEA